jgi:hypothetical protein
MLIEEKLCGYATDQRDVCPFEIRCCPKEPARKIPAVRGCVGLGADEFTLAAIAQNLRRLAKLATQPPPAAVVCAG